MKKPRKRLDRPSFWKRTIPLVLGLGLLAILEVSDAVGLVGETDIVAIVLLAILLARLVLIALLAMVSARRFRDIGWPAWIGPTILLVATLAPLFLAIGFASMTYAYDIREPPIREWVLMVPMVRWISDSLSLVLLIVAGSMPGKPARERNIEVVQAFD